MHADDLVLIADSEQQQLRGYISGEEARKLRVINDYKKDDV